MLDEIFDPTVAGNEVPNQKNTLKFTNSSSMNLNPMIHTNIVQSHYWRVNLIEINTYHEVIDEIYRNVKHLEPWERGSRKYGSGVGGGVRGVGMGGIVSSAFNLMYKLFSMKITKKQLRGLLVHKDSCYIRGVGFLLIRFALPADELTTWYWDFLSDEETICLDSAGNDNVTIGQFCHRLLTDVDWYSTKLPRIPVPIQKKITADLKEYHQYDEELKEPDPEPKSRSRSPDEIHIKYSRRSRSRSPSHNSHRKSHKSHKRRDYSKSPRHHSRNEDKHRRRRSRSHDRDHRQNRYEKRKRSSSRERKGGDNRNSHRR